MKRREHEKEIRELHNRHRDELKRAAAFWQGEAQQLTEVCETYAQTITEQDERIAELEKRIRELEEDATSTEY